jgi:hypothetical protein
MPALVLRVDPCIAAEPSAVGRVDPRRLVLGCNGQVFGLQAGVQDVGHVALCWCAEASCVS